jgi:hypothetical protein
MLAEMLGVGGASQPSNGRSKAGFGEERGKVQKNRWLARGVRAWRATRAAVDLGHGLGLAGGDLALVPLLLISSSGFDEFRGTGTPLSL